MQSQSQDDAERRRHPERLQKISYWCQYSNVLSGHLSRTSNVCEAVHSSLNRLYNRAYKWDTVISKLNSFKKNFNQKLGAYEPVPICNIPINPSKKRKVRTHDSERLQAVYILVQNFIKNDPELQLTLLKAHLIEVGSMRREFFKKNNVNFYEDVSGMDISEFLQDK